MGSCPGSLTAKPRMEVDSDKQQGKKIGRRNFVREPPLDKQTRLRKDDVRVIGRHLVLDDRKSILVRTISEHMEDNNIFEEEILSQLPIDVEVMSRAQIELEKARIAARAEIGMYT